MLFKYCTGRCRQRLRSVPSFLLSGIAELYIGARSVLITRGWGWDRSLSALRNRRLAASASRNADSRKSMVAPLESMADTNSTSDPSRGRRFRPLAKILNHTVQCGTSSCTILILDGRIERLGTKQAWTRG